MSQEYLAWRRLVLLRADVRCEWVEHGVRCAKAGPRHRMFADHKVELKDGGAPLDPANGWCLCGQHHTTKTNKARAERTARDPNR